MAFEGECYIRKAGIGETGARIVALVLLAMSAVARADYWELPFKADKCVARGLRQYSSHLLDIVGSWEAACLAKSADINGQHFDHPNRCVNKHLSGMWGEFDASDGSCAIGTTTISKPLRSGDVLSSRQDDGRTGAALT